MARFDSARLAAIMSDLLAHVAGRPADLLPFEAVREGLGLRHLVDRGVQAVPLDRIVGSLDRASEFNRAFLPRDEALRDRWEGIEDLAEGPQGFPPIDLYQVGHVYFVVDGHHRVSVARAFGAPTIEAHVVEFLTPLPLEPETSLEDILLRRGLPEFLAATGLEPDDTTDYRVTVADGYRRLLDHIRVHGYYRGIETGRNLPWPEEVASWRDTVYRPMIETIRHSRILEEFPGRTETDLYLFIMDHLHYLRERYGNPTFPAAEAMADFEKTRIHAPRRGLRGWWERVQRGRQRS